MLQRAETWAQDCGRLADKCNMQITAIALEGLERAQVRVDLAATNLSKATTPDGDTDLADLSQETVALMAARNDFHLQTKVMQAAGEMEANVVDLIG